MKQRIIIIFDHDIIGYPPTLSLINTLLELDKEVVFIGQYSDEEGKESLCRKGVQFIDIEFCPNYAINNGIIRKLNILYHQRKYKKEIYDIFNQFEFRADDLIWFIFSDKALFVCDFLKEHNYVVQFYEFTDANFGGKYKFLYPSYSPQKLLQGARNVIHCEYNRACIMNGLYGVKGKINVLPNKPVIDESQIESVPVSIQQQYDDIKTQIAGRKAVLYQGIFTSDERRLEEFCESMTILPDDYVFIAMGGGQYWEELKLKYTSKKYIFIPFVKPPYHLLFTQLASIGVLNYLPVSKSVADVINPLYCAPNKVYEYTKFGKPIICNDIPALREIVKDYNCGAIAKHPMTPASIADAILAISHNSDSLSAGAKAYYDSVDVKTIVADIIENSK